MSNLPVEFWKCTSIFYMYIVQCIEALIALKGIQKLLRNEIIKVKCLNSVLYF